MERLILFRGRYYEGTRHTYYSINQAPFLSRIECDFVINKIPVRNPVFREDYYDPVTRIRRGRIYLGGRSAHSPSELGQPRLDGQPWNLGELQAEVESYDPAILDGDISLVRNQQVRLGSEGFESVWRVIDAERLSTGHVLLTLKEKTFTGLIPDLKETLNNIYEEPLESRAVISQIDSFVDVYYRQQPTPVIDAAREAAAVILRNWLKPDKSDADLGELIRLLPHRNGSPFSEADESKAIRCAASVINRLHPRGKSSERERQRTKNKSLRELEEADSEAVAQLLGFILREIDWAAI